MLLPHVKLRLDAIDRHQDTVSNNNKEKKISWIKIRNEKIESMKWDTSHLLIKKDMLIFFLITKKGYNSVSRSGNNEVSSYSTSCIVYKKCLTPFFCHPGSFQAQICIGAYTIFSRDFFEHNLENYATLHYQ